MGTAAMVTNFCGLHANINGTVQRIVHGVADDILARLEALGGLNAPHHIKGRNGGTIQLLKLMTLQRIKLLRMNF